MAYWINSSSSSDKVLPRPMDVPKVGLELYILPSRSSSLLKSIWFNIFIFEALLLFSLTMFNMSYKLMQWPPSLLWSRPHWHSSCSFSLAAWWLDGTLTNLGLECVFTSWSTSWFWPWYLTIVVFVSPSCPLVSIATVYISVSIRLLGVLLSTVLLYSVLE